MGIRIPKESLFIVEQQQKEKYFFSIQKCLSQQHPESHHADPTPSRKEAGGVKPEIERREAEERVHRAVCVAVTPRASHVSYNNRTESGHLAPIAPKVQWEVEEVLPARNKVPGPKRLRYERENGHVWDIGVTEYKHGFFLYVPLLIRSLNF